jgi:hypothetical protein
MKSSFTDACSNKCIDRGSGLWNKTTSSKHKKPLVEAEQSNLSNLHMYRLPEPTQIIVHTQHNEMQHE